MTYRPVKLGMLIQTDPEKAKKELMEALTAEDGSPIKAAETLGVSHSTMKRWIATLELRHALEEYRKAQGLPPAERRRYRAERYREKTA